MEGLDAGETQSGWPRVARDGHGHGVDESRAPSTREEAPATWRLGAVFTESAPAAAVVANSPISAFKSISSSRVDPGGADARDASTRPGISKRWMIALVLLVAVCVVIIVPCVVLIPGSGSSQSGVHGLELLPSTLTALEFTVPVEGVEYSTAVANMDAFKAEFVVVTSVTAAGARKLMQSARGVVVSGYFASDESGTVDRLLRTLRVVKRNDRMAVMIINDRPMLRISLHPPADGVALYQVKQELLVSNPSTTSFITWSSATADPCSPPAWAYVTCSPSGAPIALDISSLGLTGSLPASLRWVRTLTSVSVASNAFSGSLPLSWSMLTSLTWLRMDSNSLTASLPVPWSAMAALTQLNVAYNSLTGAIPSEWPSGMTSLARLIATSNAAMCGPLPSPWTSTVVSTTGTLLQASCQAGSMSAQTSGLLAVKDAVTVASWPSLTGWTTSTDPYSFAWTGVVCTGSKVTALDLGFFNMEGTLPAALSTVTSLTSLNLGSNK
ncbi:hypothetical protein FOA52_009994 [Chlamydomonas sp. UWO 241]|nr:hypothetical protein FOA52_009994 [Chlamydomonas sp. UWO 241]